MTCEEFRARLSELIDNELSDEQEAQMYAHAEGCAACEEQLQQMLRLVSELSRLPSEVPVPLEAQAAWRRAVRAERTRVSRMGISRFSRAVAGVAAALLILCGATWMTRIPQSMQPAALNQGVEWAARDGENAWRDDTSTTGTTTGVQRVYGRMSDGTMKKEDVGTQTATTATTGTTDTLSAAQTTSEVRLARSAQLQIETSDFDADCQMLDSIVLSNEGYFELREKQGESEESLHAVVRVPAEGFDDFLSQMEMVGRTVKRVERARDMSADYQDVEERLNACQSKLQKLYELQESCENVNDLVTIAQSISDDIAESERLQSSKNELLGQTRYATVELELAAQIAADDTQSTLETSNGSIGERMRSGFSQSVEWLKSFCTDALVLLVSSLPRLVVALPVLALVILLIVWIVRRRK